MDQSAGTSGAKHVGLRLAPRILGIPAARRRASDTLPGKGKGTGRAAPAPRRPALCGSRVSRPELAVVAETAKLCQPPAFSAAGQPGPEFCFRVWPRRTRPHPPLARRHTVSLACLCEGASRSAPRVATLKRVWAGAWRVRARRLLVTETDSFTRLQDLSPGGLGAEPAIPAESSSHDDADEACAEPSLDCAAAGGTSCGDSACAAIQASRAASTSSSSSTALPPAPSAARASAGVPGPATVA